MLHHQQYILYNWENTTVQGSIYNRVNAVQWYKNHASPPNVSSSYHSLISSHITLPRSYSFVHDFIHSRALIVSIDRLFRRSVTVNPALEKRRSGSAAMAGIESISRAILKRLGNSLFCLSFIHHFWTSLKSWCCESRQYLVYSSAVAVDILYIISIRCIL